MKFDKRKLLSDSIYKYIRSNISNGTWKPDKQINEQKVADTLFVSRTPVRQALQRAYNEGLLGYNKYVGYFVVGNKREDIIEVFAIRIALEALQCYRAACNMSEGNWQKLQEINAEIRAISEHEGDYNCLYCLNEEFCAIIQQSAGMQRLPRFQELLSNYLTIKLGLLIIWNVMTELFGNIMIICWRRCGSLIMRRFIVLSSSVGWIIVTICCNNFQKMRIKRSNLQFVSKFYRNISYLCAKFILIVLLTVQFESVGLNSMKAIRLIYGH